MSQCHGALHPWSGRGSRRLRNVEPTHNHPKQDYRTGSVFCFSHFAVRDVLQYQRRPRRSPRRPLPESSAVSAVQLPLPEPEASPPDLPAELILQVPASPPSAVVRRLGQGRPPAGPARSPPKLFWRVCPARVVRRPRQGHPPSPPGSSAVPARVARQALFASAKAPSPPGSPAKLSFYECLESVVRRPVRVVRRPRQGRPPSSLCECQKATSLPGSPANVSASVSPPGSSAVPAMQGRPPSSFYECASAVPARVAVPVRVARQALFASAKAPSARVARQARFTSVWSLSSAVPSGSSAKVARQAPLPSGKAPSPLRSSAVPARVARQARFTSVWSLSSAVPVRVARQALFASAKPVRVVRRPRQGRPPSSFCECESAVSPGWSAVPVRVVRRPRQGRPPSFASAKAPSPPRFTGVWSVSSAVLARVVCARPPSPARVVRRPRQGRFCFCEWQSAVPARVVRRPRQGRPPSSFYECLESVFLHPRVARQALFASAKAPSPPGSSAVPARVARQALFASAKAPSPPAGSSAVPVSVPPGSPAKLFLRVPKRRPRQAAKLVLRVSGVCRPPSPSGSSAIPAKVALFASAKAPSPSGSSAVPARVARQAEPASVSPPGSSAGPARVARQAL